MVPLTAEQKKKALQHLIEQLPAWDYDILMLDSVGFGLGIPFVPEWRNTLEPTDKTYYIMQFYSFLKDMAGVVDPDEKVTLDDKGKLLVAECFGVIASLQGKTVDEIFDGLNTISSILSRILKEK